MASDVNCDGAHTAKNYDATVTITLKSDMCCGTGESDGVAVDLVTALDAYGLPIIPAKRLKGLLRESAELISDVSDTEQKKLVDGLFGAPGSNSPGKLRFGTAEIAGSEGIRREVHKQGYSPQKVADVYTITRSGTRIEDDGVVADQSLRTIQLVNHLDPDGNPTKFVFKVTGDGVTPDEKELFKNAVKCLRAIGMGKNRGLGEVECAVTEDSEASKEPEGIEKPEADRSGTSHDNQAMLDYPYRITLESDAILSGVIGQALDYIPGSMLQGLFARYFCKGEGGEGFFEQHVLAGSRFSNAYLEVIPGSDFSRPVPMTYKVIKNAKVLESELRYFDEARAVGKVLDVLDGKTPCQLVALSGYVSQSEDETSDVKMHVAAPKMSYSFHSSTDASKQGKQFYSLRHLDAGQSFCGTITATEEAKEQFRKVVREHGGRFSIGGSTSAGFGACTLEIGEAKTEGAANGGASTCELEAGNWVAIEFASDLIYIDKNGYNSTDMKSFAEHLSESSSLGFRFRTDGDGFRAFMRTVTVGGYNAKWRLPKRQYVAFKKGSVLVTQVSETAEQAPHLPFVAWAGELNVEGFGQLYVRKVDSYSEESLTKDDGELYRDGVARNEATKSDDASKQSETSEEVSEEVAAFRRGIRYNKLRENLCGKCAPNLASEFVEKHGADVSKSSAMRIGNILRSVEKERDDSRAEAFRKQAEANFGLRSSGKYGDKKLYDVCVVKRPEKKEDSEKPGIWKIFRKETEVDETKGDEVQLSSQKLDQLFSLFVRTFLSYVKQGYIAKGGSEGGKGGTQ